MIVAKCIFLELTNKGIWDIFKISFGYLSFWHDHIKS